MNRTPSGRVFPTIRTKSLLVNCQLRRGLRGRSIIICRTNNGARMKHVLKYRASIVAVSSAKALLMGKATRAKRVTFPACTGRKVACPCAIPRNDMFVLKSCQARTGSDHRFNPVSARSMGTGIVAVLQEERLWGVGYSPVSREAWRRVCGLLFVDLWVGLCF